MRSSVVAASAASATIATTNPNPNRKILERTNPVIPEKAPGESSRHRLRAMIWASARAIDTGRNVNHGLQ
jgi:hypothetical protein